MSTLLAAIPDINPKDTFADIGSGIGNVLAQVALETYASTCIGIEVREDSVREAKKILKQHSGAHSLLRKVIVECGDICAPRWKTLMNMHTATILYANNVVFKDEANFQLERFSCKSNMLRVVLLSKQICHRHRENCTRTFCLRCSRKKRSELRINFSSSGHWFWRACVYNIEMVLAAVMLVRVWLTIAHVGRAFCRRSFFLARFISSSFVYFSSLAMWWVMSSLMTGCIV